MRAFSLPASCFLIILTASTLRGDDPPPPVKAPPLPQHDLTKLSEWRVERVIDGDSIVVANADGKVRVQLAGVEIPRDKPNREAAKQFLRNLLRGEHVYLKTTGDRRVEIGKKVEAYVLRAPDGLFANLEAVRQGYVTVSKSVAPEYSAVMHYYQTRAEGAQKGLWSYQARKAAEQARRTGPESNTGSAKSDTETGDGREQRTPLDRVTVYITRTGTKYHREGCQYLRKGATAVPLSQVQHSHGPCSRCKPPAVKERADEQSGDEDHDD